MNLQVDPERSLNTEFSTGIYVRAQQNGLWVSADIKDLTRESLLAWLREKQLANPDYAISVVLILLGHKL